MDVSVSSPVSRRTLLAGAVAGLALAACGDADDDGGVASAPSSKSDGDAGPDDGKGLALVRFFDDPSTIIGNSRRLVFGLAQADGTLREEGPDTVNGELIDPTGVPLGAVVGTRRAKDLSRQYYQFRVDVPAEGIYTLRVTSAGETSGKSSL